VGVWVCVCVWLCVCVCGVCFFVCVSVCVSVCVVCMCECVCGVSVWVCVCVCLRPKLRSDRLANHQKVPWSNYFYPISQQPALILFVVTSLNRRLQHSVYKEWYQVVKTQLLIFISYMMEVANLKLTYCISAALCQTKHPVGCHLKQSCRTRVMPLMGDLNVNDFRKVCVWSVLGNFRWQMYLNVSSKYRYVTISYS